MRNRRLGLARLLLPHVDVNERLTERSVYALRTAIEHNHKEMASLLLAAGANPNLNEDLFTEDMYLKTLFI